MNDSDQETATGVSEELAGMARECVRLQERVLRNLDSAIDGGAHNLDALKLAARVSADFIESAALLERVRNQAFAAGARDQAAKMLQVADHFTARVSHYALERDRSTGSLLAELHSELRKMVQP